MTVPASNDASRELDQAYSPVAMTETLIESDTQATTGVPLVEVVAPATLPEGYTFEAEVGSQTVTITVPQGGVEEGQKFAAPLQQNASDSTNVNLNAMAQPRVSVPVGHWKDHWTNCFAFGCCHPLFGVSYCCTPIAMAQVMTRMKLDWLGAEGSSAAAARTYWTVLAIFGIYIVLNPFSAFTPFPGTTLGTMRNLVKDFFVGVVGVDGIEGMDFSPWFVFWSKVTFLYGLVFLTYMVYAMAKTRRYMRAKYAIPEVYCQSGLEDVCCSLWCPCCTASHMARHTADYDTYAATCCSDTGLPPHVPSIV